MPSPAKMNPVHHHRREITQDAVIGIDLGVDEVKARLEEVATRVVDLVALVSDELQAVKDKTLVIEDASALNAKSIVSFYGSSNQHREMDKVGKLGVKMGQGIAKAIGVTPRALDNATFEWARPEATRPGVNLTTAQKAGFAKLRHEGTRPRQSWFDQNVDPSYNRSPRQGGTVLLTVPPQGRFWRGLWVGPSPPSLLAWQRRVRPR